MTAIKERQQTVVLGKGTARIHPGIYEEGLGITI